MDIRIGDKYAIQSDSYNIILREKRIKGEDSKNPGEEYWIDIGYYAKLDQAVEALIDLRLKQSDVNSLLEAIAVMRETREWIRKNLTA